jgi:uncharacterized protein YdeI (YjbR/CyaY-like superfamily)
VNKDIVEFATQKNFHVWLLKNHTKSQGVWLKIYKKSSQIKSISYPEALDEALCFGWIDSQKKSYDEKAFLQRLTPRKSKSIWSKRNREHIERLIKEKKMTASGLREVESAKKDGRWESAYDAPSTMQIPDDFLLELKKNKKAYEFFLTLNKANSYAIVWRLQTAKKQETRHKRMLMILEMLKSGKKFY